MSLVDADVVAASPRSMLQLALAAGFVCARGRVFFFSPLFRLDAQQGMCRPIILAALSTVVVVLVAVAVQNWESWRARHDFVCLNTATTAYCGEMERIERALQGEAVDEMTSGSLLRSVPWADGAPKLADVDDKLKAAATQDNTDYEFRLKGIPHIAAECMPRHMHYYRTVDGVCNWPNRTQHTLGSVGQLFGRDRAPDYADGVDKPRSLPRATPRAVSNAFFNASQQKVREWEHTPYLVAFVEFLVHDILGSDRSTEPEDIYDLSVLKDDTFFNTTDRLTFTRVARAPGTGRGTDRPRENINERSVWLDLSQVYGRSLDVQKKLRTGSDGKLKMGKGGKLLPTTEDIPDVPMLQRKPGERVFVAGDPRANQDVLLLTLHHVYVLEHNRLCDELKRHYPKGLSEGPWTDELLFLTARTVLAGKNNMVASAYFGAYFLTYLEKGGDPLMIFRSYMGKSSLEVNPFKVYPWKDVLNPVNNAPFALPIDFSVGYRWHDLLPGNILIRDVANQTIGMADVADTSFSTKTFDTYGLASVVAGMAVTDIPHFHSGVSDQLRNVKWNFAEPNRTTGFDLVAWALESERERGVQTFNAYFGTDKTTGKPLYDGHVPIKARKTFEEFTSDPRKLRLLKELYDTPDQVDLTVGQELDESNWPGTSIPTSVLAISFYTLSRGTYNDRFSMNWIVASCLVENQPWSCRPTNVLQEVFWKPISAFKSDHIRWIDSYWLEEFDMKAAGANMLWRLLVRNTDAKCLQKNVFFKASDKNPIICYDVTFFPGPKNTLLSLDWLHWHSYGSLQPYWHDARKYGGAVYYKKRNQHVLLLSEAELLKPVFEEQAFLGRPRNALLEASHSIISGKGTNGIADRELGAVWSKLRKTVAGFAATIPAPLAERFSEKAAQLAQQFAASSQPFDPFKLVQSFTVDLYGEMAFGDQYERQTIGESLIFWTDHARNFFNGLDRPEVEKHLRIIGSFLDGYRPTEGDAWFDVLLRERSDLPKDVLKATMFDVLAYSQHNAFTVNYALFLLGVRPQLQQQLVAELRSVGSGVITVAHLHRLPLLMKTVKEINRAYPGGGGIMSRQSFEDTEIDARIVPAGTVAIVNSLLLHHDPRHYERPNEFDPSRWSAASFDGLLDDTNKLSFLTYGAGEKSCPANRLAMMQQAIVIAKIVDAVEFVYTPMAPPKVELGFGARASTPVQIVAKARA